MTPTNDFYIGYETRIPRPAAHLTIGTLAVLVVFGPALALAIVAGEHPFAAATFEFGLVKTFTGRVTLSPYPTLVEDSLAGGAGSTRALLVAPGKHGAAPLLAPFDGQRVTLTGTLIYRERRQAIEVEPGSIAALTGGSAAGPDAAAADTMTLRGEIVDGKCYLGVMNPGQGATHRDCAVQCIRGGLPPLFAVATPSGRVDVYTLASSARQPVNAQVAALVGRAVEITGRVVTLGDERLLLADPSTYRLVAR
jgi:hypothetical protein